MSDILEMIAGAVSEVFAPGNPMGLGLIAKGASGLGGDSQAGGAGSTTATQPSNAMSPDQMNSILQSIRQQFPDLAGNAMGGLSPESMSAVGATSTGNPDQLGLAMQAVNAWLGRGGSAGGPGAAGATQSTPKSYAFSSSPGLMIRNPFNVE